MGCWLATADGNSIWIDFRFEKLPDYYYICGCLDHNDRDCDRELDLKYEGNEITSSYGHWLRVETYTPFKGLGSVSSLSISGQSSSMALGDDEYSSRYSSQLHSQ